MQREERATLAADLLAELLDQTLYDEQSLLERLLDDVGQRVPAAPVAGLGLSAPPGYAAPVLRPVGGRVACAPARPWGTLVTARPLRAVGAAMLAGVLLAASAGAAPAHALGSRQSVAAALARSGGAAAPARGAALARAALSAGRTGAAAVRTITPARAGARAVSPAALPAFELEAAPAPAAPAAAPASVAPASRAAAIPQYVTMQLPAVDLAAQVLAQPPYPQNAPLPPPPPQPGQPAPQPPVIIYQPPAAPAPAPARPARPVARPTQPAARPHAGYPLAGGNYIVQRGDYLRLISYWSYSNERLWPVIYDSNLRVIGANPDLIYPGQVLAIPTGVGRPAAPSQGGRAYTVRAGDTLAGIAARTYGNANRWPEIYAANRAAIGAYPARIFPGTTLRLP